MAEDTEPYYVLHLNRKGLRFSTGEPLTSQQLKAVIAMLEGEVRLSEGLKELDVWIKHSQSDAGVKL